MIKKVIIGLILLVCICSGAFSVIYHYNPTNTSDIDNTDSSNIIGNTNNEDFKSIENNPLTNYINHIDDTSQYSYGYIVNVNGELRHYLNNVSYYLESEGILDRYTQCAECGGYIPIGKITNPLPKAAICHHNDIGELDFSEAIKYSRTRDEVYNLWVYHGMPVYDDIHSEIDVTKLSPIVCNDYTRCNECHGFVPLNANGYLPDKALCHHYNGSLNADEIPKDNLYDKYDAYFIFQDEEYASNEIIGSRRFFLSCYNIL